MSSPAEAQKPSLRSAVAKLLRIEPDAMAQSQSLREFRSSIRRMTLETAVSRALGRTPRPLPELATYEDLERFLLGSGENLALDDAPAMPTPTAASVPGSPTPLAIGIDIEAATALPDADDYWEHEFYLHTFTDREIGYCRLQPQPKIHFAARWCAKEALRKCDPQFAGLDQDPKRVEVGHDAAGAPTLWAATARDQPKHRLPHALSLSHTDDFAVAVVAVARDSASLLRFPTAAPAAVANPEPRAEATLERRSSGSGRLALLLALAALLLSVWNWWRTQSGWPSP